MAATTRRPGLVTALVVLVVLTGIVSILSGIIAITAAGSIAGGVAIVIGLVYLAVSKGLLDGRNWARVTVGVVSAVNVLLAVITIINTDSTGTRQSAIGSGIFGLIVLAILFSPKANAFFGSRSVVSRPA